MNDLVKAARDALDLIEKIDTGIYSTDEVVSKLQAAVERAEKQESVGFNEWFPTSGWNPECVEYILEVWQTAQQVERERIKALILETHGFEAANLLRRIDGEAV